MFKAIKFPIEGGESVFDEKSFNQTIRKDITETAKRLEEALGGKVSEELVEKLITASQLGFKENRECRTAWDKMFHEAGKRIIDLSGFEEVDVDKVSDDKMCEVIFCAERLYRQATTILLERVISAINLGIQMSEMQPPGLPSFENLLVKSLVTLFSSTSEELGDMLRKAKVETDKSFQ